MKNKKLLFLGGDALTKDVVQIAKNMGVFTLVTDWYDLEKSPAKLIADKSFMISNQDIDALSDLIKAENIDGVLTGFTDSTLQPFVKICEKEKFPCYINQKQVDVTTSKEHFKSLCKKHNLTVVEEYDLNYPIIKKETLNVTYPVIVKPVDNSGARGIRICNNYDELVTNYEYALSFSESKKVIVERCVQSEEASIFIVAIDGEYYTVGVGDRHIRKLQKGHIPLPVGYIFPSKYMDAFYDIEDNLKNMLKGLRVKNGLVFIQSFVENGRFVLYEMGFRLTGSMEYKLTEEIFGINAAKMLINYALFGKMIDNKASFLKINLEKGKRSANLTFMGKPGVIGALKGINSIRAKKNVISCNTFYKEGQIIPDTVSGTLLQVVARVLLVAEDFEQLFSSIKEVIKEFKLESNNGENLLLDTFDVEAIKKQYCER